MPRLEHERRIMGLLGLSAKAGRLVVGVPLICEALRRGADGKRPLVLVMAEDASRNTQKRIQDKAAFYSVPQHTLSIGCEALALAVGKRGSAVAAVGVTEPQLAAAIEALFEEAAE